MAVVDRQSGGILAPFDPTQLTAGSCWVRRPGDDRISPATFAIHQMGSDNSLTEDFIGTPALPGLAGVSPVLAPGTSHTE